MKSIVLTLSGGSYVFDNIEPLEAIIQTYGMLGGAIRYEIFGEIAEKIGLSPTVELFNECCDCDTIIGVYSPCYTAWEVEKGV